jgi:hypothetical protein
MPNEFLAGADCEITDRVAVKVNGVEKAVARYGVVLIRISVQ